MAGADPDGPCGIWAGAGNVSASAQLSLAGGTLGRASVSSVIDVGGLLDGFGGVLGSVANAGIIAASGAGQSIVFGGGTVTNAAGGTIRALSGAMLDFSGATALVHHGLIDRTFGTITFPSNFTHNGILLDSSVVRIKSASRVGNTVSGQVDGYTAHSYRLQKAPIWPAPPLSIWAMPSRE